MSEIDNSTLVESAMEMPPVQEQQTITAAESELAGATAASVSNQEAMIALVLSRIKKQSKQIEIVTKQVTQLSGHFRDLEKKQSKQSKEILGQIKSLQKQLKQVQKQVAGIRARPTSGKKRKLTKKSRKSRAKRR
jgi:hypothetical protein